MPTFTALPGTLGLQFRRGDDFSTLIDFSPIDLVGFTVTSTIVSIVTGASVGSFTTSVTDASAGKVNISLSDTQTAALQPATYRWQMVGTQGSLTRTYLNGFVEVVP